jgi:hypothetical protein
MTVMLITWAIWTMWFSMVFSVTAKGRLNGET